MAYEKVGFSGEQYVLEKGVYRNCDDWGAGNSALASLQPVLQVRAGGGGGAMGEGLSAWEVPPRWGRDWKKPARRAWGGASGKGRS